VDTSDRAERVELLAQVPLLHPLDRTQLEEVAGRFAETLYAKGDVVWREGDPADRFLVVVRGQLDVWGGDGEMRIVSRVGPGGHLGEIGLLLEGTRTATVTASRATRVLALDRQAFHSLIESHSKVGAEIARGLGRELHSQSRGRISGRMTLAVGVASAPGIRGKTLVATTLAALLARELADDVVLVSAEDSETRTLDLVDLLGWPWDALSAALERVDEHVLRLELRIQPQTGGLGAALGELVERLSSRIPTVVVDIACVPGGGPAAASEACDVLVQVTGSEEAATELIRPHTPVHRVLNLFNGDGAGPPISRCEPFVLRTDLALVGHDPLAQARHLVAEPRSTAAPALHRLARKLLGRSVGLALGGGAAFGIAHVGVLEVLEKNGVAVDMLAGASMGSIVALGYAAGISPDEMIGIARRIGNKRTTLSALDVTLTRPGLLAGNRLKAIFKPFFGSVQTFAQLSLPCQTVAADIETGERVCLADGPLEEAFRASASVPILWSPVRHAGRTLVDGAIVDPVPADVVYELGADVCIAVNVVPTLEPGGETVLSRASRWANSLNPFAYMTDSRQMPNVIDIGMNALQLVAFELGSFKARDADVLLNIDLADFTWIEFYRAEEIIERGAAATEAMLPVIRDALARPAGSPVAQPPARVLTAPRGRA
jgi:NTE family protein